MGRWYCAFRCVGDAREILEHITHAVRQYDLGKYVAAVRFEKGARRGEFYLYLGIRDVPEGRIPDEVGRTLLQLPYFSSRAPGVLTDRDLRKSTGSAVALDTYGRSLHYINPPSPEDEDVFSLPAEEEVSYSTDFGRDVAGFERLMYWLGATGAGSWNAFRAACVELGLANTTKQARSMLRRLILLGHVESSLDRSRWSAGPPLIVQQDRSITPDSFFLCGARDARLVHTLVEVIGDTDLRLHLQDAGPQFVGFRADMHTIGLISLRLESCGTRSFQYAGNSARLLANALPTIEDWIHLLPEVTGFHPYRYQMKRFNGYSFVDDVFAEATGFYEVWPMTDGGQGHTKGPTNSLLYDSSRRRWTRGDWYGLRYLAMWLDGHRPGLRYGEATGQLAIPVGWRWPELYERSLVLASGRLPRRHGQWLVYESVSRDLVCQLQSKLKFNLEQEEGLDA